MSAVSKQSPEHQALMADLLQALVDMPTYEQHVATVPTRLVKTLLMKVRTNNDLCVYDEKPCGRQWNVLVSQSTNADETTTLVFRKVENEC